MCKPLLKRMLSLFACLAMIGLATGCQCTSLTDHYGDTIDDISDYGFCMDCFYNPCWDLTRIGHSDWERCKFNRAWCGKCRQHHCENGCEYCDGCPPAELSTR
ncbi:MAG: hypothetical protein HUJ26_01040 [Planctomycetaceae bacterium]|nr:hypothetical protein [Planctomycetaceae bacterium]